MEDTLIDIANDFIEKAITASCQLAKHRGSSMLEAKDVMLHLGLRRCMFVFGCSTFFSSYSFLFAFCVLSFLFCLFKLDELGLDSPPLLLVLKILDRNWNMRVPGFFRDDIRPGKAPKVVDAVKKVHRLCACGGWASFL